MCQQAVNRITTTAMGGSRNRAEGAPFLDTYDDTYNDTYNDTYDTYDTYHLGTYAAA